MRDRTPGPRQGRLSAGKNQFYRILNAELILAAGRSDIEGMPDLHQLTDMRESGHGDAVAASGTKG